MEREGSLPCSQEPATDPYPDPDASSPHIPSGFIPATVCSEPAL
jgi:hypothetical protein